MSVVSDSVRIEIMTRAGFRCEYCRLPTRGQIATFPIDHIRPVSAGGSDDLSNLALSCPHCNGHKWKATEGTDAVSGEITRLFNPRVDAWAEHFAWSTIAPGQLIPKSAIGRVTADRLRLNDTDMIALRRLLAELDLFREILG